MLLYNPVSGGEEEEELARRPVRDRGNGVEKGGGKKKSTHSIRFQRGRRRGKKSPTHAPITSMEAIKRDDEGFYNSIEEGGKKKGLSSLGGTPDAPGSRVHREEEKAFFTPTSSRERGKRKKKDSLTVTRPTS